jgi:hypothetical protein
MYNVWTCLYNVCTCIYNVCTWYNQLSQQGFMANTEMQMQDWGISLGPGISYLSMLVMLNGWQTQCKMLVMFCLEWIQRYCTYIIQTCTYMSYTFTYMYITCIHGIYNVHVCMYCQLKRLVTGRRLLGRSCSCTELRLADVARWLRLMGNEVWLWTEQSTCQYVQWLYTGHMCMYLYIPC